MAMGRQAHLGRLACGPRDWDWSQAAASQGLPDTAQNHWKLGRGKESPAGFRRSTAHPHLDARRAASSTLRECTAVALSNPVRGALPPQPQSWDTIQTPTRSGAGSVWPPDRTGSRTQVPESTNSICAGKDLWIMPMFWRQENTEFHKESDVPIVKKVTGCYPHWQYFRNTHSNIWKKETQDRYFFYADRQESSGNQQGVQTTEEGLASWPRKRRQERPWDKHQCPRSF